MDKEIISKLEYKGKWWLPDNPEKQISGTLKIMPNKEILLELEGVFKDIEEITKILEPKIEIILGISLTEENITLYECFGIKSNVSVSVSGLQISSLFRVNEVFIGVHFQKSEDVKFKELFIRYLYLDEWINVYGFNVSCDSDEKEVIVKYKQPYPIQASIGEDCKISIEFELISSSIMPKEINIKQRAYVRVKYSTEKSLNECWDIVRRIQNFLSFGVGEPVYSLVIKGMTEANKQTVNGKFHNPPVEIYHRSLGIPKARRMLLPCDMLFTFKDISEKFEIFLRNWFEKANILEPVYNLYFQMLYNPRLPLQLQFLSLIQAIEAYHRCKFEGKYLSDDDYKPIYEKLTEFINGLFIEHSFKDALKSKLKYGNEYSL